MQRDLQSYVKFIREVTPENPLYEITGIRLEAIMRQCIERAREFEGTMQEAMDFIIWEMHELLADEAGWNPDTQEDNGGEDEHRPE
jgi:hypothetical protein